MKHKIINDHEKRFSYIYPAIRITAMRAVILLMKSLIYLLDDLLTYTNLQNILQLHILQKYTHLQYIIK